MTKFYKRYYKHNFGVLFMFHNVDSFSVFATRIPVTDTTIGRRISHLVGFACDWPMLLNFNLCIF